MKMAEAIGAHPNCKYVLFLGDGCSDISELSERFCDRIFYSVKGNNDFSSAEPFTREINLLGHRLFMTHGHMYNVKYGLSSILQAARERGADIALFGHTHERYLNYDSDSGIYLFNPGAVGAGYFGNSSYGVLTISQRDILLSFGEL